MDSDPRTVWCGNLPEEITEELLYELFLQAGPVEKVSIPKECNGRFKPFGFITFKQECSVPYAIELLQGTTLFGMQLRMKPRCNQSQRRPDPISNSYQSGTANAVPMTAPIFLQPLMMSMQLLNNQARLSDKTDNLTQNSLRGQWNRNQNSTQKVENKEKSNYNHNRKNNDSRYSPNRSNSSYDRLRPDRGRMRPDNDYDHKRSKKKRKMEKY